MQGFKHLKVNIEGTSYMINKRARSMGWKVQVPYTCKPIVENDELYPVGWSHRRFFPSRQGKSVNQNKKFHQDPVSEYLDGLGTAGGHNT